MHSDRHLKGKYGASSNNNFEVVDSIPVGDHPFTIGPRHVEIAADHFGGILGNDAIACAEKHGVTCYHKTCGVRCTLPMSAHEKGLLVECKLPMSVDSIDIDTNGKPIKVFNPELHTYLLSIKDKATADGYAGFAFVESSRITNR